MTRRFRNSQSKAAPKPRQGANSRHRLKKRHVLRRARWAGMGQGLVRRVLTLGCLLGAVGALGYGAWLGFRAYQEGRVLTVNRIEVIGNQRWSSTRLLEAAGLEVGKRWSEVSSGAACDGIRQLPGIQEVTLRRSLSGDVRVRVKEEDVLALRRGRDWRGLTPSGAWMPLGSTGGLPDLPVIEGGSVTARDAAALSAFLAGARSQYPDLFGSFSQIATRSPGEADIYWRDGRIKVRVDYANKSLNSLEFLRTLLRLEGATWPAGRTVDLRVEGYAYVL